MKNKAKRRKKKEKEIRKKQGKRRTSLYISHMVLKIHSLVYLYNLIHPLTNCLTTNHNNYLTNSNSAQPLTASSLVQRLPPIQHSLSMCTTSTLHLFNTCTTPLQHLHCTHHKTYTHTAPINTPHPPPKNSKHLAHKMGKFGVQLIQGLPSSLLGALPLPLNQNLCNSPVS